MVNAITAQNVIAPSGTIKLDRFEYQVETNSAPTLIDALNNLPIKTVNGAVVYIRDVAHVRDGNPPQTNIVRVDGRRAIMMNVLKTGSSSTLDIIKGVRDIISSPSIKGQLPPQLKIAALSDQSIFVRSAISGVVREAIIAACLTAIMILVFLGSWRSTIIIAVSIPLSILCSLILLDALHQTINIMTLGGMALAVGILVDDATVAIENINRYLETGKELEQAILDGSAQIATPAFVSTLAICIVFVPMFFLSGRGALPVCAHGRGGGLRHACQFLPLAHPCAHHGQVPAAGARRRRERAETCQPQPVHALPTRLRSRLRAVSPRLPAPAHLLRGSRRHLPYPVFSVCPGLAGIGARTRAGLFPLGRLRPVHDSRARAHRHAHRGDGRSLRPCGRDHPPQIPANEITAILDNIGLPNSSLNLAYSTSAPVGPSDADIQVQLSPDHHPSEAYIERLRAVLAREYPGVTFYVVPVDIVTADPEFWSRRAHRYSDRRPRSLRQPRPRRAHVE